MAPIIRHNFHTFIIYPHFPQWINQDMATNLFKFVWLFLNWYKLISIDYLGYIWISMIIRGHLGSCYWTWVSSCVITIGRKWKGCKKKHTELGDALLFFGLFLGHMWLPTRLKNSGESFGTIFLSNKILVWLCEGLQPRNSWI